MKTYSVFAQKPVDSPKWDISFIIPIIFLLGFGLITLLASSANYASRIFDDDLYFVKRQLLSIFIGMVFLLVSAWISIDTLRKLLPLIVIGSFILCFFTFVPGIGIERNGASRWISLPFGFTFQPSELAKLAVVLFLANLFSKKKDKLNDPMVTVSPAAIGLFAFVLIVFFQNDFSTAIFILLLGLIIFFIVGVKMYWFAILGVFAIPATLLFIFTRQYRVSRLIAFLRPEHDINGANYQINMSRRAISTGGFWGQGIGGVERANSIPEVQADFIFAGWAESMGFIGVLAYMAILGFFAWKAFRMAFRCTDLFRSLIAFGCTLIIVMQSLMNCGVVCGAIPATGIPLPFFSAGGSSIMITLCLCGLLINVSRYKNEDKVDQFYE